MAKITPMMRQYLEIKKGHPDSILFFRLGDFYEMFADDAKLASRELNLTLTSRDRGKREKAEEDQIPMCGVPYQASQRATKWPSASRWKIPPRPKAW